MDFKRPTNTCCWCEFFSIKHHETQKTYDWPDGWCKFNLYQTDELQACSSFQPNVEHKRLSRFFDWIEGRVETL